MVNFSMRVCALFCAACITIQAVAGNPYLISDARVRNIDVTPALGRGYSIATNSFKSTCLLVEETTVPSYNYDCK